MTCEVCERQFNYCFYINDEHWLKAVGRKEGRRCAHCILEALGGLEWYVIWNQPTERMNAGAETEDEPCSRCNGEGFTPFGEQCPKCMGVALES